MSIKKLAFCFAAVALASSATNAQISIQKRLVTTPSNSTSPGGVAVIAIPAQSSDVCTVSNGKCGIATVGGGFSSPRPWTNYFLGQSKSYAGFSLGPNLATVSDTIIKIDEAGRVYFSTASFAAQGKWMSAGQPTANETLITPNQVDMYCSIYPTWSNNSNKLAGFAPDSWSQSGQHRSTEVGCGQVANSEFAPPSSDTN